MATQPNQPSTIEVLKESHRRTENVLADINSSGSDFIFALRYNAQSAQHTKEVVINHEVVLAQLLERVSRLESDVARLEAELNIH